VCPSRDIKTAINIALRKNTVLLTYGDMLRVPVYNTDQPKSLLEAKTQGADVKYIISPVDAIRIANENPQKQVVFFSVGFETTTAPLAHVIRSRIPDNLSFLISHKLTPPAMELLLGMGDIHIDGLIAPGHVSAITGEKAWQIFPEAFRMPTVIAGFEPEHVIMAIYLLVKQIVHKKATLENVYRSVVSPDGNMYAKIAIESVFDIGASWWRGIGKLPASGYHLKKEYQQYSAITRFDIKQEQKQEMELHPGCSCHLVVMGKIYPPSCPLFKKACTPETPYGPCMISQEGACKIWWKYHTMP
jgi:hydrogenase expression/formation protein HypD